MGFGHGKTTVTHWGASNEHQNLGSDLRKTRELCVPMGCGSAPEACPKRCAGRDRDRLTFAWSRRVSASEDQTQTWWLELGKKLGKLQYFTNLN